MGKDIKIIKNVLQKMEMVEQLKREGQEIIENNPQVFNKLEELGNQIDTLMEEIKEIIENESEGRIPSGKTVVKHAKVSMLGDDETEQIALGVDVSKIVSGFDFNKAVSELMSEICTLTDMRVGSDAYAECETKIANDLSKAVKAYKENSLNRN